MSRNASGRSFEKLSSFGENVKGRAFVADRRFDFGYSLSWGSPRLLQMQNEIGGLSVPNGFKKKLF
jgi:hypothetical protein